MNCVFCDFECWMMDVLAAHLLGKHKDIFKPANFHGWVVAPRSKCFCGETVEGTLTLSFHLEKHGGLEKHFFDHFLLPKGQAK